MLADEEIDRACCIWSGTGSTQTSHNHPRQSERSVKTMGANVRPPDRLQFELKQASISQLTLPQLNFAFGIDTINIPVTQHRAGRFFCEGNADVRAVTVASERHGVGS